MTTPGTIQLPEDGWRYLPHLYAEHTSNGRWKPYDYLQLIGTEIARAVFSGGGRLIVSAPPRHGKSELISFWAPIWYLDMMPHKRIILTTYEADFAAHWGRRVRNEIQGNADISVSIRQDSSAADRWETPEGGGMITAGVGGPITGRGGDLVIIDDPVKNWEQATSATYRKKAKDWFNSTVYTRLEPGATIVVLMTRWHEDDLAGWLLREHSDKWRHVLLPSVAEESDELGRQPGEALCPDRYPIDTLIGKDGDGGIRKAVGPIVWNGLHRQNPSSLEGGIIKRAYFKYWTELPKDMTYAMSIDCAFEKTDSSSFVVIQVWGRKGADRYLVDQIRERMDFVGTCEAIKEMSVRWPLARLKLIEAKANGAAVVSALRSEVPGLVKYMPRGSKAARLAAISPLFASHNVYIPSPTIHNWVPDYVEELVNMPNSPNDDQADATSQMLEHWEQRKITGAAPGSNTRSAPIPL